MNAPTKRNYKNKNTNTKKKSGPALPPRPAKPPQVINSGQIFRPAKPPRPTKPPRVMNSVPHPTNGTKPKPRSLGTTSCERKLNNLEKDNRELDKDHRELDKDYKELDKDYKELDKDYKMSEDVIDKCEKAYKELDKDYKELDKDYKMSEDVIDKCEKEYKILEKEHQKLENNYEESEDLNVNCLRFVDLMENKYNKIENKYNNIEKDLKYSENEREMTRKSYNDLIVEHKKTVDKLNFVAELGKKMNEKQKNNQTRKKITELIKYSKTNRDREDKKKTPTFTV